MVFPMSRGTQILQSADLFVLISETETDARKVHGGILVLIPDKLQHELRPGVMCNSPGYSAAPMRLRHGKRLKTTSVIRDLSAA
jgi:hypothetical protein